MYKITQPFVVRVCVCVCFNRVVKEKINFMPRRNIFFVIAIYNTFFF